MQCSADGSLQHAKYFVHGVGCVPTFHYNLVEGLYVRMYMSCPDSIIVGKLEQGFRAQQNICHQKVGGREYCQL